MGNFRTKDLKSHIESRILKKQMVEGLSECWLWQGSKNHKGYGYISVLKKNKRVHRVYWEEVNGHIPEGLCLLHKCDIPPCINPEHEFLGTNLDNIKDRDLKGRCQKHNSKKTHCKYNHIYSVENTIWNKNNSRTCKKCKKKTDREYHHKNKIKLNYLSNQRYYKNKQKELING